MYKVLLAALLVMSAIFTSCDKEDDFEVVKMRINHYQQPVNNQEFYQGLSYEVHEGDKIGEDKWYGFLNKISGFEYELGYIYDIEVLVKEVKNPMVDGASAEYSLLKLISKSKVPEETNFEITLSISSSNGFESLVSKNEFSKYTLMGKTEIECGDLCDALEENINNKIGMVGTFQHINSNTIQLLELKAQEE